jgi:uncharacterized protein YcnI
VCLTLVLTLTTVSAHVTVQPRQSEAGAVQRYTVRVPTEGQVPTESVELIVPVEVEILDVPPGSGYVSDIRREGGRIVAITWTRHIPPGGVSEFGFVARNPRSSAVTWKARQRFSDGSSIEWAGPAGDKRPASVTELTPVSRLR